MSLLEARHLRDQAREDLAAGHDPAMLKKLRRGGGADTFQAVARAWHAQQSPQWTERHAADVLTSLEPVFKLIGDMRLADITAPTVLAILRGIEARPAIETAHRVRQRMSAVFVHGIATGLAAVDPAAVVAKALSPQIKGRQPAVVDLDAARTMLAQAESIPAHPLTRLALRFLALTAVRPGEVRGAAWSEIEGLAGSAPLWRIPAERMKMKREHLVPLSLQAVEVLAAARTLSRRMPLVFPSTRNARRPLSENAMGYLLNRAGYHAKHVPHGFRATFSTVMNEQYRLDRAVIDLTLAHVVKDTTEAAYNRSMHMGRRRELAQIWADTLLQDAAPADVLLLGPRRSPAQDEVEEAA